MKTKYSEETVWTLFDKSHKIALRKVSEIPVYCGVEPKFGGLRGWVFEQTIRFCLQEEFKRLGIQKEFKEQVSLGGKAKVDLQIDSVVIETKTDGLFSEDACYRCGTYKKESRKRGWRYLLITSDEKTYRKLIIKQLGEDSIFFVDEDGDWKRFVSEILKTIQ